MSAASSYGHAVRGAVLVSAPFWKHYGAEFTRIAGAQLTVRVHPSSQHPETANNAPLESVVCAYQSADTFGLPGFDQALLAAPKLEWLHVCTAGADRPLLYTLQEKGALITTSSGANARPVAHSAMAALLSISRKFPQFARAQQQSQWQQVTSANAPADLEETTATILGQGPIGREIARLCQAFGIRTIGVRRSNQPADFCDETISFRDLDLALPQTHWLIIACPLTADTDGLITMAKLQKLPNDAAVINVSRGRVIVEDDLIAALQTGVIGSAYADVFREEPLPANSPLWQLPNMIVSPHSAGISRGFGRNAAHAFFNNLERWLNGLALNNIAPPPP